MALDWSFYMLLGCSIAGIAFFIYSLVITGKIRKIFPTGKVVKKWLFIQILIIIFLIGYVANIIVNLLGYTEISHVMTAIVYIFGGLFVFIVINLSYKTYKLIVESNQK